MRLFKILSLIAALFILTACPPDDANESVVELTPLSNQPLSGRINDNNFIPVSGFAKRIKDLELFEVVISDKEVLCDTEVGENQNYLRLFVLEGDNKVVNVTVETKIADQNKFISDKNGFVQIVSITDNKIKLRVKTLLENKINKIAIEGEYIVDICQKN